MSDDLKAIVDAIVGRRVVAVRNDTEAYKQNPRAYPGVVDGSTLILDDGTELTLYMSDSDCCAKARGEWVTNPDRLDAAITSVTITPNEERDDRGNDPDYGEEEIENYATVTVMHNQNPIAQAECSADNGNGGYYYSILSLAVKLPGSSELAPSAEVVSA